MSAEHLTEEGVAESMSVESVSLPLSEDLLNRGAPISVSTNIVDKSRNGQCDQSSQDEDGIIEENVKLDAESREGDNGQCDQGSQDVDGMIKEEVRLDAESREGNSGTEEMVTRNEKTEPSSLAPQNTHDDDILIEAQHDIPSEPAAESGIIAQVADADNQENLDHKVVDESLESTLHVCSSILRQSSGDLKGQKVAVALDNVRPLEANMALGDAFTQEVAATSEPNVQRGGDAAAALEMVKETPVLGNKQDELPVLPEGDRSTECGDPLSSSPVCPGTSEKEILRSEVKHSDSNINSSKANELLTDKESSYLQDLGVPDISKKDHAFSFDPSNTSDKDINKVWQPFSAPETSTTSGTVEGCPVALSTTPKSKKRPERISKGVTESSHTKIRRWTVRKGVRKRDQPDETNLLGQFEKEERPANSLTPVGSSLSNLNISASVPTAFQQPFTDLQQLQLRAQIFVYGSLIQGTAPDEACLISAFGGPDGGRSIWEKPWQKCFERVRSQILQTNMKSPVLQGSDNNSTPDQTSQRSAPGNKLDTSSLGSAVKIDFSHAVNPILPLSSPLWNMHTSAPDSLQVSGIPRSLVVDRNLFPPLHSLQTPTKNIGHATSWSSHASLPSPWVASAQTYAWDPNTSLSALPSMEPVKLIPVKDSSLIAYSTANHSSADPILSKIAVSVICSDMVAASPTLKSLGQIAKDPRSKKRKKDSISVNPRQLLEPSPHSSESVMANPSGSIRPASVKVTCLPTANMLTSSTTPLPSADPVCVGIKDADRNDMPSEDTLHQVNLAKLHAEEAAACAEAAVSQSENIWGQLDKQKGSGLTVDPESKVASAAAAIAAAASVAKAAAAAAKLASDAALQAKLMADEVMVSNESIKLGPGNGVAFSNGAKLVGEVTPASILKGENRGNSSSSVISAAKEAARRKIETALAASKHAENLDAIVKAAELAAEAVALAGRVVALGNPLPLSALEESGPKGYGKLSQQPPEQLLVANSVKEVSLNNETNDGKVNLSKNSPAGRSDSRASQHTKSEDPPAPGISSLKTVDDQNSMETSSDNHMEEGSTVEVFKEWGTAKAAWFAARVLELKNEEVYVRYIEKKSGDGHYKEWITLSCEDNTAPIVRTAHPVIAIPPDGARKRQRTTIGSIHSWGVGDRVDAWMEDCWWEGVVIEKNSNDESSLTVQFPAQDKTGIVKAWNLRPSLIWKDGAWVEWSNSNESVRSGHEDDAAGAKRQKLSSPQLEVKGKSKATETSVNVSLRVHDQSTLVCLTEDDKTFNIGKSTRDDGKCINARRMVHTGLQKEGSKVIFGVPKPGKKTKFMDVTDVSKHFDAGVKAKVVESDEPHKTSRLPISRRPHGWKNSNSRTESQPKMVCKSKPKVVRSTKAMSASEKSSLQKNTSVTSAAAPDIDDVLDKDHSAGDGSASGTERLPEPESCSEDDGVIDDSILISSLARPLTHPSSKRPALGIKSSEGVSGWKVGLSHAKMADVEEDNVFNGTTQQEALDGAEPRRSNRRIQPTSRLLEGLQNSLSIPKLASSTPDSSMKSHNKNTTIKESNK